MTVASLVILSNLQVSDYRTDVQDYHDGLTAEPVAVATSQLEAASEEVKQSLSENERNRARELVDQLDKMVAEMSASSSVDPVLGAYLAEQDHQARETGGEPLATVPYDTVLDQSLRDFKGGKFESFQGTTFREMQRHDLNIVKLPYVVIGLIVIGVFLVFAFSKMPNTGHDTNRSLKLADTFGRLFRNKGYVEGVFAQTFYVGAQIMCWTFIIHYATTNLGMSAAKAQKYNMVAMAIFLLSRFICTFLLKYIRPGRLLMILAAGGILTSFGTMILSGMAGLYSLILISACMSLMFPTIYGIALDGMGEDAKVASAGLIFAIVGGALMPPLQGKLIDLGGESGMLMGLPAVSASFVLPLLCFVFIAFYGWRTFTVHEKRGISEAV
jgi:fucose permease